MNDIVFLHTPMKQTLLSSFPIELTEKIFQYLSLRECDNILEAYGNIHETYNRQQIELIGYGWYNNLKDCSNDRRDIGVYLQQHFRNSKELLKSMLLNDVYISGSRALDFFTGDATSENSDWDFFVDANEEKVSRFMLATSTKCNIVWLTAKDDFMETVNNSDTTISINLRTIQHFTSPEVFVKFDKFHQKLIKSMDTRIFTPEPLDQYHKKTMHITNQRGIVKYVTFNNDYTNDPRNKISIINGKLKYKNCTTRIQLTIVAYGSSVLPHWILNFHSSLVQCFISGIAAVHMYASDAYSRTSRIWDYDTMHRDLYSPSVREAIGKYEKRGYVFKLQTNRTRPTVRIIRDIDCEVIKVKIANLPASGLHSFYSTLPVKRDILYLFSWTESEYRLQENRQYGILANEVHQSAVANLMHELYSGINTSRISNSGEFIEIMEDVAPNIELNYFTDNPYSGQHKMDNLDIDKEFFFEYRFFMPKFN